MAADFEENLWLCFETCVIFAADSWVHLLLWSAVGDDNLVLLVPLPFAVLDNWVHSVATVGGVCPLHQLWQRLSGAACSDDTNDDSVSVHEARPAWTR